MAIVAHLHKGELQMTAKESSNLLDWIENSDTNLTQIKKYADAWKMSVTDTIAVCKQFEPSLTASEAMSFKQEFNVMNFQTTGQIQDPIRFLQALKNVSNLSLKEKSSQAKLELGSELRLFTVEELVTLFKTTGKRIRELWTKLGFRHKTKTTKKFSLEDIHQIRKELGRRNPKKYLKGKQLDPLRRAIYWGVMNQKGGVGKTTTTLMLAQYLCLQGYHVLMIDLDPQASLSTYSGVLPHEIDSESTIMRIIDSKGKDPANTHKCIHKTKWQNLDIIYGHPNLITADRSFYRPVKEDLDALRKLSPEQYEMQYDRVRVEPMPKYYRVLEDGLKDVEKNYDIILFDTPPNYNFLSTNVSYLMDGAVIPILPQPMTEWSMGMLVSNMYQSADLIRKNNKQDVPKFRHFKYLPSMVDKQKNGEDLIAFQNQFPNLIYQHEVTHKKGIVDSTAFFLSPVEGEVDTGTRKMLIQANQQIEEDIVSVWENAA